MRQVRDYPSAKKWAEDFQHKHHMNVFRNSNSNFELIEKALDDFLEKKREVFQRFYFLSNEELLVILSTS